MGLQLQSCESYRSLCGPRASVRYDFLYLGDHVGLFVNACTRKYAHTALFHVFEG